LCKSFCVVVNSSFTKFIICSNIIGFWVLCQFGMFEVLMINFPPSTCYMLFAPSQWRSQKLCIRGGADEEFQNIWELSVAYLFRLLSQFSVLFSGFILVLDDLTMFTILHVVDDGVYRQWGACDESWILKSTDLVFRKCSYPW
jgi:hypothetical protein